MQNGNFADRFIAASRRLGHPLGVGLDPHLDLIPPDFRSGLGRRLDEAVRELSNALEAAP
jgi:hypothetical protein